MTRLNYSKIILRLGMLSGSLVLALILAETAARLLVPAWMPVTAERKFWVHDPVLGWFHRAGSEGTFRHPDFSTSIKINSHGLRDDEHALAASMERRRILVVGDSMGWGYGVEVGERFTELLAEQRPDWELINACVSGYGTDQELLYLKQRGLAFQPDTVLLLVHPNDFENILFPRQYWHDKPYFKLGPGNVLVLCQVPVPKPSFKQRVGKYICAETYLYAHLYRGLLKPLLGLRRGTVTPPLPVIAPRDMAAVAESATAEQATAPFPGARLMSAILEEMAVVCRDTGAELVVVSCSMAEDKVVFLKSVTGRIDVPYLSLNEAFAAATRDYTFPHDIHWTRYGHEVVARAMEPFLDQVERTGDDGPLQDAAGSP